MNNPVNVLAVLAPAMFASLCFALFFGSPEWVQVGSIGWVVCGFLWVAITAFGFVLTRPE